MYICMCVVIVTDRTICIANAITTTINKNYYNIIILIMNAVVVATTIDTIVAIIIDTIGATIIDTIIDISIDTTIDTIIDATVYTIIDTCCCYYY